jgi:hypothetical protein
MTIMYMLNELKKGSNANIIGSGLRQASFAYVCTYVERRCPHNDVLGSIQ